MLGINSEGEPFSVMSFIRIAQNPSKYILQETYREEFVRWQTFYPSFGHLK